MANWVTRIEQGRGIEPTQNSVAIGGSISFDRKFASLKKTVHQEVIEEFNSRFGNTSLGQDQDKAVN